MILKLSIWPCFSVSGGGSFIARIVWSLLWGREVIKGGAIWRVGNDKHIDMYKDN